MQKVENTSKTGAPSVEKMFEAGVHYGYSKSRRHPSVSSFIYATKNSGDIINLEKTTLLTDKALEFVKKLGAEHKVLLFVGTKAEAREIVKSAAEGLDMPYVDIRWIGGTLTNFGEIKKRVTELEEYNKKLVTGGLDKYTKRERTMMAKDMDKLSRLYGGLLGIKKVPDALFIVDPKAEHIALTEANNSKIPVVALANSDTNIKNIDYPIVGNDSGLLSIKLFTNAVAKAYKEGSMSVPEKA